VTVRIDLTQGDVGERKTIELDGVLDFTGATVVTTVWQGTVSATLTAYVVNGTNGDGVGVGLCTVLFGSWLLTAALGTWKMKHRVTFPDATKLTWPEGAPDVLHVGALGSG
jgi:hypothetical protein